MKVIELGKAVEIIDRRMTCGFTSFSTVFQSYQEDGNDNERLCAVTAEKILPQAGLELRTARSVGQHLTH